MKNNIFIYLVFSDPKWIELINLFCKKSNLKPSFFGSIPQLHKEFQTIYPDTLLYNCCKWLDGFNPNDLEKIPDQAITIEELTFVNQYSNIIQTNFSRYDHFDEITYDKYFVLFYNFLIFWKRLLIHFKPKCIFFSTTPHHFDELILYYLAKFYKIKTLSLQAFQVNDTYYTCINHSFEKNILFKDHYPASPLIQNTYLKNNTFNFIERVQNSTSYQKPFYEIVRKKEKDSIIEKFKKSNLYCFFRINTFHRFPALKKGIISSNKIPSRFKRYKYKIKSYIQGIRNKNYYNKLTNKKLSLNEPYIYVALHLQPESTSSPMGGLFTNQFLMINLLSKSIPSGWKLYVKEHPASFKKLSGLSFANRPLSIIAHRKTLYNNINNLDNASLVPLELDSYSLIDNAKAIATLTGTVGIEAVLRDKPVFAFGYAWYRSCPGIFGISSTDDLKQAIQKIINSDKPNIDDIRNYLNKIEKEYPKGAHSFSNSSPYFPNLSVDSIIESLGNSIAENILLEK